MIRFLAGNLHGAGSTPGAYSETDEPGLANPRGELGVGCRVVAVDTAAEDCDRQPARLERAAMGLAVDSSREAADDDEAGPAELPAEHPRDLGAIGRARPRADHAHRSRRSKRSRSASPRTNIPRGGSWIACKSGGNAGAERESQRTPAWRNRSR